MTNPYLDRKTPIGNIGRKAEKRAARKHGAALTPASGATRSKGDMELGQFLIESKSTTKASIAVEYKWLAKIEVEALAVGKMPVLLLQFLLPGGGDLPDGRWLMMPERLFKELVEAARE